MNDACFGGFLHSPVASSFPGSHLSVTLAPLAGPGSAPAGLCLALGLVDRLLLQSGSLLIAGVWLRQPFYYSSVLSGDLP